MTPGKYTLFLVRGNTYRTIFRLKTATGIFPLTNGKFVFSAFNRRHLVLRVSSPSESLTIADPASGEVEFFLSAAQTRLFPIGAVARYELEYQNGIEQTTILEGPVNAQEGINDD